MASRIISDSNDVLRFLFFLCGLIGLPASDFFGCWLRVPNIVEIISVATSTATIHPPISINRSIIAYEYCSRIFPGKQRQNMLVLLELWPRLFETEPTRSKQDFAVEIVVFRSWPHRLTVRTSGSHPGNRGSI